ncbi:hypothetical protein [uncultured Eudoraea sp.]|uniref:hypothetical protein n=1 Tax=uncultured Eudoraea sp. TaxID=1035614 RepID=UPI0026231DEC|nr:hypothetical protein [uncultured Eudoraea sp.]
MLDSILEYIYLPLYGIVLLLSLWRYPRYYDTPLRFLPVLLMYTFLTEILGQFIRENDEISLIFKEIYYNNNWLIFNIYNIVFFLYFYFVYYSYVSNKNHRKLIKAGAVVFLVISIVNLFFQSFATKPQLASYIAGALILISCIFFYRRHLKKHFGVSFLKRDLLSWLSLGILIFYVGYLPIKISRNYPELYEFGTWLREAHLILIVAMNVCFAYGFINMRRRKLLTK